VDPTAGPDDVEKRKIFLTVPGLELRTLGRAARSQSLSRLPGYNNRRLGIILNLSLNIKNSANSCTSLHCLHPVVCRNLLDFAVKITIKIKINQSNCSHWFYLTVATCFGPHMGPSSGSPIKYVSFY
jgi:hypothetical protein